MNETHIDTGETTKEANQNEPVATTAIVDEMTEAVALRPDDVPEKFWDEENATVRVDAMAKSYQELERKLGTGDGVDIPKSAEEYEVTIDGEPFDTDADVNERLHAAGFSQQQVQMVYELANEKLMPALADMADNLQADGQTDRLKSHFGGEEKWNVARAQISAWGQENFSNDVFQALSNTYEGVLSMQRMMTSKEPGLGKANAAGHGPNEKALKSMMGDPRYWRDNDKAYIERVRRGFQDLYPEN